MGDYTSTLESRWFGSTIKQISVRVTDPTISKVCYNDDIRLKDTVDEAWLCRARILKRLTIPLVENDFNKKSVTTCLRAESTPVTQHPTKFSGQKSCESENILNFSKFSNDLTLITWSKGHVALRVGVSQGKSAPCLVLFPLVFCK